MTNITKELPDGRHIAVGQLTGKLRYGQEIFSVTVSVDEIVTEIDGSYWVNFCGHLVRIDFAPNEDTSKIPPRLSMIPRSHDD